MKKIQLKNKIWKNTNAKFFATIAVTVVSILFIFISKEFIIPSLSRYENLFWVISFFLLMFTFPLFNAIFVKILPEPT